MKKNYSRPVKLYVYNTRHSWILMKIAIVLYMLHNKKNTCTARHWGWITVEEKSVSILANMFQSISIFSCTYFGRYLWYELGVTPIKTMFLNKSILQRSCLEKIILTLQNMVVFFRVKAFYKKKPLRLSSKYN